MNHSNVQGTGSPDYTHHYASDWITTAQLVPLPSAAWMGLSLIGSMGAAAQAARMSDGRAGLHPDSASHHQM